MRLIVLFILIGVQQNLLAQFGEGIVPFKDGNKWGWADVNNGKIVIEPVYDSVKYDFYKNVFLIYKDSKVGAISYEADRNYDKVWKVIIEPIYDEIYRLEDEVYITVLNNKKEAYLENYGIIVPQAYHDFDYCFSYISTNQYIYSNGNFQFLLIQNKEYKGGVFDIKSKKIINSLRYNVYRYGEGFWTDSFKSQAHILLKYYIFKDENGKFFYLSNFLEFKEVKEGVDFNAEKHKLSFRDFSSYERFNLSWDSLDFNSNVSYFAKNSVAKYHEEYKLISSDWNGNPVASNREGTKYGILSKQTKMFLIQPKYDKLTTLDPRTSNVPICFLGDFFVGHNGDKKTFFINYIKTIEDMDDYLVPVPLGYNRMRDKFCMIYRRENLYGFLCIKYVEEMNSKDKKLEWKLFKPKYKSLVISNIYSNVRSYQQMHVFEATDENGETFFVNENGIEFRR